MFRLTPGYPVPMSEVDDHGRQVTYSSLQEILPTVGAVVSFGSSEIMKYDDK
jgi:hypothetical protein